MQLIPKNSRVLDIGCSSGNLGATLRQNKNCEVIGLDLDEKDIQEAKKKLNEAFVMNAETDDLSKLGKFDCVILADVIEHLVNPVQALIKINSVLKESGSVIFSIPNMAHMGTRLMVLDGRFAYGETGLLDKTHLHYYDREEIERIFKEAGYNLNVLDWVERYIPEKVLKQRLAAIGVKPNASFIEKSKQIDAVAYEYIGQASHNPQSMGDTSLPFVSPHVMTTEEHIKHIEGLYSLEVKMAQEANKQQIQRLKAKQEDLLAQQAAILSSTSWKLTKPIRQAGRPVRKLKHLKNVTIMKVRKDPRFDLRDYSSLKSAINAYKQNSFLFKKIKRDDQTTTAVVVHLFYPEAWQLINEKIKGLKDTLPFDLFITLPIDKITFANEVLQNYPNAHIFPVPNRGRDVLPFIKIASELENLGYISVLKLHSKKSPHRKDGQEWFANILSNLLPQNTDIIKSLAATLEDKKTGIIGPTGQYISLVVNFGPNSFLLSKALRRVFSNSVSKHIEKDRKKFGFFAGTMFWARLDALRPVLDKNFGPHDFEKEKGSIDTTMAHALERVFSLCPEIEKKNIYDIGQDGVQQILYKTDFIPEWSELHPHNKKIKTSA